MRLPTLLNDLSNEIDSSENKKTPPPNRRHFLRTMGIVGVGLALAPKQLFADTVKSYPRNVNPAWLASCEEWRTCVKRFVTIVSAGDVDVARWIKSRLDASDIDDAPRYRGFHYDFAPTHVFNLKIDRQEVICGNGFMVDMFPYYGDCTCTSYYDLNAPEMTRLTNPTETAYYNCVLAPAGKRIETNHKDHADYEDLRADSYENHDPDDWSLKYKRRLVSVKNGKHYMGYGLEHKRNTDTLGKPTGDVLITPYDV